MRALFLLGSCLVVTIGCSDRAEPSGGGAPSDGKADQVAAAVETVARSVSAAACDPYKPLNDTTSITLNTADPQPEIVSDRSLVITAQAGYSAVGQPFSLGRLLKDDAHYINYHICKDRPTDPRKVVTDFMLYPFKAGARDVDNHNDWDGLKVGTTATSRNTFQKRIVDAWNIDSDENGPFRLLAVVNRMDLAGDDDTRGGGELAGAERRWFGEGRLVYGLTQDVDGTTPYPMTLIMEYRLPALKETRVDSTRVKYELDTTFDYAAGPANDQAWRDGRARWAKIWRELSRHAHDTPKYQALLLDIAKLFATGDNHLALRTGEKVFDADARAFTSEFEYREFYLNDQWTLATRKLRREPFLCAQGSTTLANRIASEWNPFTNDFHYTFMLGDRQLEEDEVADLAANCGGELPYGQDLNAPKGTFGLRAKFTRFTNKTVWTVGSDALVGETKRHKTAAATCSGCHSTETGNTTVFHISPRLAGDDSKVSAFLSGQVSVRPLAVKYTLNEIADRSTKLANFAAGHDYSRDYLQSHADEQLFCNESPCAATP